MSNEQKMTLPLGMLALEFLGTALIGLGLAKKFADLDFLLILTQYDKSRWLLIGLSFFSTLPFIFYILAAVREKAESSLKK